MLFIGYRWLDDRIAIRDVFDDVGSKYVPPHVNIFYCFGGLVFTFINGYGPSGISGPL